MPSKSANVKNEKQYEALKGKAMSKLSAAPTAKVLTEGRAVRGQEELISLGHTR